MATEGLEARVREALRGVKDPRTGDDVLTSGHVQGVEVGADGSVRVAFHLGSQSPGTLVREVREAVEAVAGGGAVKVDVKLPQTGGAKAKPGAGPAHPPGTVPVPRPQEQARGLGRIVAVSSGKGGVGKSTVAANLAAALAVEGQRVGLLDADIYGPDIPQMFGERRRPKVTGTKGSEMIEPLEAHGVKLMSLGFLLEPDQPAIMRGPLVSGILKQFLEQVEWGDLDTLVVDMPPGTGDAQLSLVQTIDVAGVVMVTTPQEVSTGDVRRAVRMFERVNTRVLGIVENMAGFHCPHCGEATDVFGRGGGEALAAELELEFLGSVPLDVAVREAGDAGRPTSRAAPDSAAGEAFRRLAARVAELLGGVPAA